MNEPWVDELDMPPRAYFQIPTDVPGDTVTVAAYQMKSGPFESEEQAQTFSQLAVARVKNELLTLGGGIIWWRVRPEVSEYSHKPGVWHFYGRCGTSPTLPNSFWSSMGHRDQ